VTVTEPAGITVSSFQVAIAYDPSVFTVSPNAQIGATFAALGTPSVSFAAPGEIIVQAASAGGTGTIPDNTTADLFDLTFTLASGAADGPSVVNLLQNIGSTSTAIFANDAGLTQLTLSPAPTNNPTDPVDGTFTVGTVAATTTTLSATSAPFSTAAQNVTPSATVTSSAGTVNAGTVTFTNPLTISGAASTNAAADASTSSGPRITAASYNREKGRVTITFDDPAGIDPASLANTTFFVARTRTGTKAPVLKISRFQSIGTQVTFKVAKGHSHPSHIYLEVVSGGVQDLAGNGLDGAFSGTLPSGNGHPGSDFFAELPIHTPKAAKPKNAHHNSRAWTPPTV